MLDDEGARQGCYRECLRLLLREGICKNIGRFFRLKDWALISAPRLLRVLLPLYHGLYHLRQSGDDRANRLEVTAAIMATCISAGVAAIMMGLYTNHPIAFTAGMGENAFYLYHLPDYGYFWRLGCVFIEGVLFMLLTVIRVRQAIMDAIPQSLRYGIACGIGLLIAFVGLKEAGLIVAHPATLVTLGDVTAPWALLAVFGLLATGVMLAKKIKGAILWGILITAAVGVLAGIVKFQGVVSLPPSMAPTFMQMDIAGAFDMGIVAVIFIFLFIICSIP